MLKVPVFASLVLLAACSGSPYETTAALMNGGAGAPQGAVYAQNAPVVASADSCGAGSLQNFVGGPSMAVMALNVPGDSRHYGSDERVATNDPSRLNFVHSGSAVDAVVDPGSTVIRIFCG